MPISGVVLGGLILGEPITVNILIALLLIVSGILLVNFRQKRQIPLFPIGRNV
jgi:drug/metabolite transporter (DMT)-like permease